MSIIYKARRHGASAIFRLGAIVCFVVLLSRESHAQITFKQIIGSAGTGDGQFDGPFGMTTSLAGDLYVADYSNHRVQVFNAAGVFKFSIGSEGTTDGKFKFPTDVSFGPGGDLYVLQHDKVQVFNAAGGFIRKFAVSSGFGLAIDPAGAIFVIGAFEVMKYNSAGELLKSFGTNGHGNGQFDNAYDGVVDRDGRLYVVEVFNHRVQVFTGEGEFITAIGSEGSGDGQFKYPSGIALDGAGNIYVADQGNHRIQILNFNGTMLKKFGTLGTVAEKFQNPVRVLLDGYGKLFIADNSNDRVQVYSKAANSITNFENIEKTYGDESFVLSAQSSSTVPVVFSEYEDATTTGDVIIDGFAVLINRAGTIKIRAYAGDNIETSGAEKIITLTVHRAAQIITFDALPPKILGTGNVTLPEFTSAGLPIEYVSTDETVATVDGHVVTLHNGGETTIVASNQGNENYNAAETIEQTLTVQVITDAEEDQSDIVKIHPNPTADFVVVDGNVNRQVNIVDYTGRSLNVSKVKTSDTQTLDLRPLPSGIYLLKVEDSNGSIVKRILKK